MRSTIIPAQITTVEDKIAGNLSFTQMVLLMIPVVWSLLVYAFLHPTMQLNPIKIMLMVTVSIILVILSIRIRGQIILEWLLIYGRYSLRPAYYIFDKNDCLYRKVEFLPETIADKAKASLTKPSTKVRPNMSVKSMILWSRLLRDSRVDVQFKTLKEGRLNVAYQQVDR